MRDDVAQQRELQMSSAALEGLSFGGKVRGRQRGALKALSEPIIQKRKGKI
jgi:hypothetical protein